MLSNEIVARLLELKKWKELNITQKMALDAGLLDSEDNFVIIAPTATGKTGVAQLAILKILQSGGKIAYLVPMKPIISEKKQDFEDLSKNIAGAESTPSDWNKSDIVITTFESFYRTALIAPHDVEGFSLVVVDEFHVLYDPLRGFNLEKVMTILKDLNTRIICLSATFEDKDEISRWLNAKVVVVPEEARKIKLEHDILDISETRQSLQNKELCKKLLTMQKQPYLVFCTTKEATKNRAVEMCSLLDKSALNEDELHKVFSNFLTRKKLTSLEEELQRCLTKGVAFHHSGLDQRLKSLVEKLFLERRIDYLFATTGLAYGMNLPAKTVVVADTSFYDSSAIGKRTDIPTYMYIQMAGRAGRPGLENEGYAYVVKKQAKANLEKYMNGKIERAVSHVGRDEYFRKTILELIYSGRSKDEQILSFFKNTFYNFQSNAIQNVLVPFNLFEILRSHALYLCESGFIVPLGAPGYKLTDLGEVTISFLFNTFSSYELMPFIELNRVLNEDKKVRMDHSIIYRISSLLMAHV